jgi:hypothetical protein
MGIEADIFPARGSFYVATQDKMPYCSKWAYQTARHFGKECSLYAAILTERLAILVI